MELHIFSRALQFIGVYESFSSFQFNRRYQKCGDFELQCPRTSEALFLFRKGNIIWKQGTPEAGYIEYRKMKIDEEGKKILVIKGRFLTGYLDRRIIWGQETLNTTIEDAMRYLVDRNAISPSDPDRIIPGLVLGDFVGYDERVDYQTSYSILLEEVERLCALSVLGYRIRFDVPNGQLIFEVYSGVDRTSSQIYNPKCTFSQELDNVQSQTYTDSDKNYKNLVLVGGMGEGDARTLITIGSYSGLDRFEMFDDAKDLTNVVDDTTLTDEEYRKLLTDRGNSKLSEHKEGKTFDADVNLNNQISVYKKDWDLGDIVTYTSSEMGLTLDTRIIEVQEVYEDKGLEVKVVLGNNIPTIVDKIKSISSSQTNNGTRSSPTDIDGGSF